MGGAGLWCYGVPVMPVGEGTAELEVSEVAVPDEFVDLGLPGYAYRGARKWAEAKGDAGAQAGGDGAEGWRKSERSRARWRRGEGCFLDAGLLPWRHEAGKIFRVREEREDEVNRVWEPLLRVKGVAHGWVGYSSSRRKARGG